VRDIARWHDKTYLATLDGGVVVLGGDAIDMRGGNAAARKRASSVVVADGALWAGTRAGLYQLRARASNVYDGPRDVTSLLADGDALWIGASDGVWLRDKGAAPRSLGGGEIRHLARIDGAIVGAGADGVVTVDRGRVVAMVGAPVGCVQAIGARGNSVCTGGLDGLWTRTAGNVEARREGRWSTVERYLRDGRRRRASVDRHVRSGPRPLRGRARWVRIAGVDARINALALEPRPTAHAWGRDGRGIMVVSHDGAIARRIGKSDGLPSRSVLSIARLADGRIIAGTSVGAAFVDGATVRRVGPRPPAPAPTAPGEPKRLDDRAIGNVWAIAEAGGQLWLGTTTGVYRGPATAWTSKDGSDDSAAMLDRWQRMSVATGHLKDDWVTAFAVRGDVVWVGTYNGGVARIDGDTATLLGGRLGQPERAHLGWRSPARVDDGRPRHRRWPQHDLDGDAVVAGT